MNGRIGPIATDACGERAQGKLEGIGNRLANAYENMVNARSRMFKKIDTLYGPRPEKEAKVEAVPAPPMGAVPSLQMLADDLVVCSEQILHLMSELEEL